MMYKPVILQRPESEYYQYISGKRVIFVGPGSILKGRGLGSFIDSFDVVIRTNNFPMLMKEDPSLAVDYGEKCSVLYMNYHYARNNRPLPIELFKSVNIKWLCSKKMRPVDMRIAGKIFHVRVIDNISNYIYKLIGDALMGSVILHDVVSHCPGEFFITGIDFFLSRNDNYGSYANPDYISDKAKKENIQRDIGQGKGHDIRANARYMLSMYDQGYFSTHDFVLDKIKAAAE